jgi:drug/metabolite transporter (DMT)-like permease
MTDPDSMLASPRKSGYVMAGAAAAGWGLWPVFLARAERGAPIPAAVEGLFPLVVMSLVTLPFAFGKATPLPRKFAPWMAMAWLGVSDAGNVLSFFSAYQRTSVAIAVLTHYLTPLLVALFAPLVIREPFERKTLFATALAFAGLVVLLEPWRGQLRRDDIVGAALGTLSAFFYASNVLVQKRAGGWFSPAQFLCFHGVVAIPILWLAVPAGALGALHASAALWLTAGSILLGAVCGVLFLFGLQRVRASHASILTLMEPLVAVAVGVTVLGQPLRVLTLVGGAMVLTGAAWALRAPRRVVD